MTIVPRAENDIFRLAPVSDIMVNPVNTQGAMGKGLAAEFKVKHPAMYKSYREMCLSGKLKIGKIQVVKDPTSRYRIVNLPTKDHYMDRSEVSYIRDGLRALRRYLTQPENKYATVAMPMLGCGEGRLGYEAVIPEFYDQLDDLDAVVMLSMRPEFMPHVPKYLGIIGPRVYGCPEFPNRGGMNPNYELEVGQIKTGVVQALLDQELTFADFDALVSGGANGVDRVAIGQSYEDPYRAQSIATEQMPDRRPIICFADWDKFGNYAGMRRNRTIMDIATHIVAFLPPHIRSVGTVEMVKMIKRHNAKVGIESPYYKHLTVIGNDVDVGAAENHVAL